VADVIWALGLLETAARGCPATFLKLSLGLSLLILLAAVLSRGRTRPAAALVVLAVLSGALAWAARDRLLLLGDSRIWVHNAEVLGSRLPVYRAPLSAIVLGRLTDALRGVAGARDVLAVVSVLAGIAIVLLLWPALRCAAPPERRRFAGAFLAAALFTQPLALNFYGHVEAYPFALVLFAIFLAALHRDVVRGGAPGRAGVALTALVLSHVSGALAAVPLAARAWARWRARSGRIMPRYLALLAAAAALLFALPVTRAHTLLLRPWEGRDLLQYALDVLNGWFLLFVPLGLLALRVRRAALADDFGRLLGLMVVSFALFPVLAYFELGLYRDLDLLGPAFVSLALFTALGVSRDPRRGPRIVIAHLVPGALLLAAIQTLANCPAGAIELERHLRRGAMTPEARASAAEILAFYERERDDLPAAEAMVQRAIAIMPGNLRRWGLLGEIQLARGDTTAAIASLERSMTTIRAPRTAPILAELYVRSGRIEDALRVLRPIADSIPHDARASAALAVAYSRAGMPESTLAVVGRRLREAPDDDVARFNAAAAWSRLGSLDRAAEQLAEAARLRPENRQYQVQLLRVLLALPDGEARANAYLRSLEPALAESLRARF
jgi:tetratricopeptide (TPR) repeat protein